jgi:hypothetical protein
MSLHLRTTQRPVGPRAGAAVRWGALLWLLAEFAPPVGAADGPVPGLDEIAAAHTRKRDVVRSLLVRYEVHAQLLVDAADLEKHANMALLPGGKAVTVVFHGKHFSAHIQNRTPDPQVANPDRQVLYDGRVLKEVTLKALVDRAAVRVSDDSIAAFFPTTYLDIACFAFDDPDSPALRGKTKRDHIPNMFADGTFKVRPTLDVVDGTACVVLESPGWQKVWLDPQTGFAVCKREWYDDGGAVRYVIRCRDFARLQPELWLPRRVEWITVGKPQLGGGLAGKPLVQDTLEVRALEVNQEAHARLAAGRIEPGSYVLDETITPLDAAGRPLPKPKGGIKYVQPADEEQLASVVLEAQHQAGRWLEQERMKWWLRALLGTSAGGLLALFLWLRWRARKKANQAAPS